MQKLEFVAPLAPPLGEPEKFQFTVEAYAAPTYSSRQSPVSFMAMDTLVPT